MHNDDEGNGDGRGSRRREKSSDGEAQRRQSVVPDPHRSAPLCDFLERLFWVESGGFPQKLVLSAVRGRDGMRLGPSVKEIVFPPGTKKPDREALVEMANLLLSTAQSDCDALGRPTRYGVHAHDLVRNDRSYERFLIALRPSGMTTALQDERWGVDDDDEGALSSKLLMKLLDDERRDKRWHFEQMMHTLSGVVERQDERLERVEALADASWAKAIDHMKAAESLISQAEERRLAAEWQAWKKEKLDVAIEKVLTIAPALLPALLGSVHGAPINTDGTPNNPARQLLSSLTPAQGHALFGEFDQARGEAAGGIFTSSQLEALVALARAEHLDDSKVSSFAESITPAQLADAQKILTGEQLIGVVTWLNAPRSNGVVQ